ncbi:MAG: GTP-binding protein, partial [Candidatus Hodarchaeota archaeon]
DSYKATMGLDLSLKEIEFPNTKVRMQLWDMAGTLAFKQIRLRFYGGAKGALLVYDATRPSTFENLEIWLRELEENVQTQIPFIILGNKSDLEDLCVVTEEEEKKLAVRTKAIANFRTSAKTGANVEEAFQYLAEKILVEILQKESIESDDQVLYQDLWDEEVKF